MAVFVSSIWVGPSIPGFTAAFIDIWENLMGLRREIERDNNGVVLAYWHLAHVVQRLDAKQIDVTFHPYVNEAAYKSSKRPAGPALQYTLVISDFPPGTEIGAVSTGMLYSAVKAKAAAAAKRPRDGNSARLPEVDGIPTDPALADAADVGLRLI